MADRMAGQGTVTGGVRDVSLMTPEELEALAQRITDRKRQIRHVERQRQRLLPRLAVRLSKLSGKRTMLTLEIDELAAQIEGIKEGRPVELTPMRKGRVLSQAQKAAMRENLTKARAAKGPKLTDAQRREKNRAYQRDWQRKKKAEKRKAA